MSAIDCIQDRKNKKLKYTDTRWSLSGSGYSHQLVMDGEPQQGNIDWTRSRYLKVGHDLCFFAWCSGSGHYKIFSEKMRVGYEPPKDFRWSIPEGSDDDDE